MKQLILIGGGEVFDSKDEFYNFLHEFQFLPRRWSWSWKDRIIQAVSAEYTTLKPQMPSSRWADYMAWKIWFERQVKENKDDVSSCVLVWFSLWWSFLLRYLSENTFDKSIYQLHLVSSVLYSQWAWWFVLNRSLISNIEKQCDNIYIYHSSDDEIVPYDHGRTLSAMLPKAKFEKFKSRWHFLQPAFPELLHNIWVYAHR